MNNDQVEVRVVDVGADAVLVRDANPPVLMVRPGQTFSSAVVAIGAVMPHLHIDAARRLVRKHLPEAFDLSRDTPGFSTPPTESVAIPIEPPSSWRQSLIAAGVTFMLGIAVAVGYWGNARLGGPPAPDAFFTDRYLQVMAPLNIDCDITNEGTVFLCVEDGNKVEVTRFDHPGGMLSTFAVYGPDGGSTWYITRDAATYKTVLGRLSKSNPMVYGDGEGVLAVGNWQYLPTVSKMVGLAPVAGNDFKSPTAVRLNSPS